MPTKQLKTYPALDGGAAKVGRSPETFRSNVLPTFLTFLALVIVLVSKHSIVSWTTQQLALFSSLGAIVAVAVLVRSCDRGLWSTQAVCGIVLAVFHLGAMPELAMGDQSSLLANNRWIFGSDTKSAIWIATVGMIAYTAGALTLRTRSNDHDLAPELIESTAATRMTQANVGSLLLILSVGWWFMFAVANKLSLYSSYGDYRASKGGGVLQLVYIAMGVGLALSCVAPKEKYSRIALFSFFVFAAVAMPIGLRGEVLFPAAAGSAVLAYFRRLPSLKTTLILATGLLSLTAAISGLRQGGLQEGISSRGVTFSPMAGIAELGGSLRVVESTVRWHERYGVPYTGGETYAVPISDFVDHFVLRARTSLESENAAYMSTQISIREGNIGGSIIGEANSNWGTTGVVLIMLGSGALLSILTRLANRNLSHLALLGCTIFAFMMHVRNAFGSLPLLFAMSFAAIALASARNRVREHNSKSPQSEVHS